MPICSECQKTFFTVKALVIHLQLTHRYSFSSKYICGETGCCAKFDQVKTFKKHMKNVHSFSDIFLDPDKRNSKFKPNDSAENEKEIGVGDIGIDCEVLPENNEAVHISVDDFKSALHAQSDAFVAKLYSNPTLPRSHVQHIINDADAFLGSGFLNIMREKCLHSLKSCNAEILVVKDIEEMFDVLQEPFCELKTEYLRIKRFTQSGNYVPPQSYLLGKELKRTTTQQGVKSKWVDVSEEFVPLRDTLKKFLELPNCLPDILSYVESLKTETETISNFVQGELWKSKIEKFDDNDIVLPLFCFFDDFECNNVLGPHSGKLGGVYTSIPCLPPECQASLDNIFLALLFNSKDRVEFGNEKILEPLIQELKYLEETGIAVQTKSGTNNVKFVLGLVIGDNLGIHQLCGFVESFNANYPCRFCKATKCETQTMVKVDLDVLRTLDNYNTDLETGNVSLTGLNGECEFNKIPSFHITSNYAADFMHDVAEGSVSYILAFIISVFIKKNFFTLNDLNTRIRMFDFGRHSSNKPPCITEESLAKGKLKMTASESLCFVRHFGVLVGDLVPLNSLHWRLYLSLMRVVEVVLAKTLPVTISETFPLLVEQLLSLYLKLSNKTLKPKFHHLLHYSIVMKKSGPVSHLSCMRFEAKHRQLKQTSVVNMSRVNLSHSIAVKHQLNLCNRFLANQSILTNLDMGPIENMCLCQHDYYIHFVSSLPIEFKNQFMTAIPNWIDYKGTFYKPSMVLLTGRDDVLCWPMFGKIQMIFIDNNSTPVFVCNMLRNIGFSDHYYAYEVKQTTEWFCISFNDLIDPLPLSVTVAANGDNFVVLKYMV